MFDIIQSANDLFGSAATSYKEILPEFICEYKLRKDNLPTRDNLLAFLSLMPRRDKMTITFTSETGSAYVVGDAMWTDEYSAFIDSLFEDDDITALIKVTKGCEGEKLSVYSLHKFTEFICSLKIEQLFENFTFLFQKNGEHIVFELLDTNGSIRTRTIAFSDNVVTWVKHKSRIDVLKDCDDASVFLERSRIRLSPQDFEIIAAEGGPFVEIKELFGKLRTVLAYVYLANTATIHNNIAVLQFDPSIKGYEYELESLTYNENVAKIYDWIYKGDSCVDKASIARKIINTYCRTAEDILAIDEKVFNSIKSDYVIYQKNHADQYIDMKNKISDYIVESAEKIQDLSHDISDAFRNNFVAVIVFLMTVLLTDSIDFSEFLGKEVSPKVTAVCAIFTVATLLYYLATVFMGKQKWNWLSQSYKDLKNNYVGVFDEKDIEEAFHHDEPLVNAEKQYKSIKKVIGAIWIALFLALVGLTGILIWQGHYVEQVQSEQSVVEPDRVVINEGLSDQKNDGNDGMTEETQTTEQEDSNSLSNEN